MKRITLSHNRGKFSGRLAPTQNPDWRPNWYWKLAVLGGGSFLYQPIERNPGMDSNQPKDFSLEKNLKFQPQKKFWNF